VEASHPADPDVLIAPFALIVARRAWRELIEALDAAGPSRFEGPFLQHYHHLQATAYARLGDVDEALRHLTVAESLEIYLCTARLPHLRQALESLPGGADDLDVDRPTSAQLVAILLTADARLAAGDVAGAITVLERPLTRDLQEVHSLSRLAAAYLALEARTPAERFRKSMGLARFVECIELDRGGRRAEGLAPGLAWSEDRIAALHQAALAWLEAEQGTARAPWWRER